MVIKNDTDRIKVRTGIKCYLTMKNKGTAREIFNFLMDCNLKLRVRITPNIVAQEIKYCMATPNQNFLKLNFEKNKTNTKVYYLEE